MTTQPRHKPVQPPVIPAPSKHDLHVMSNAGLKLDQWRALTDQERANIRWNTPATNEGTQ